MSTMTKPERDTMTFTAPGALPGDDVYKLAEVVALQAGGWGTAADIFARSNYQTALTRTDAELRAVVDALPQIAHAPEPGRATPLEKAIAAGVLRLRAEATLSTSPGAPVAGDADRLSRIERALGLIAARLGVAL